MTVLEVVHPGTFLSVQDRGRTGFEHLGVPRSGACDAWGHAVANLLAGAPPDAATLEVTLGGAEVRAIATCVIALAGADLGARRDDGRQLPPGTAHRLPSGARVRFVGSAGGLRAYLGLAGGIAADRSFGSASSLARGGLGAFGGRALRAGDRVEPVRAGDLAAAGRTWPDRVAPNPAVEHGPLRLVAGPDLRRLPDGLAGRLTAASWRVGAASDRMGLRLEGPSLGAGLEIVSHGVVPGSLQVPADGQPLVILPDGPTVGGYPVVGVVARADQPRLGQLRPGDDVSFALVTAEDARVAWREQRARMAAAAKALDADAVWQRLADGAAG